MRRWIYGVATLIAAGSAWAAPVSAQPSGASVADLRLGTAQSGDVQQVYYRRRHYYRGGFGLFLPGFSLYVGPRYRYRYYRPYYYDDYYYAPNYYWGGPYYYGGYGRHHRYYRHGRGFRRH